ncbi:hypothetical protein SAMN04487995_4354 [Dyadobacter koreensis]|uniref:Uncharacterized protein n=1 Tax=Dyadobacter koreensis TaxID=408657 RepID=A0A1H6Y9K0_9BACT|nr:hypothetical protein [Dyadobacter koreensis]SEJ37958.1 hypothetical protein SAMN04487995_4354 [Dyadobacter koreensis]
MTNEPAGGPWGYLRSAGGKKGASIIDDWKQLHLSFKKGNKSY